MYKITVQKNIFKVLKNIPLQDANKIRDTIRDLEKLKNPLLLAKKLKGHTSLYRYRVGNYRIIVENQQQTLTILIIDINHRKDVYKKY